MDQVALAIVGCGGMGRRHIHGLAELREALARIGEQSPLRLTTVIDTVADRANALADEAEAMLGERPLIRQGLDQVATEGFASAVDLCTATESHHPLGVAALNCGLHLFVEKPLAVTIRGASAVIAAAQGANRTLGIAENVRREPVNRFTRALIEAGAIGDVRFVLDLSVSGGDAILLTPWRHRRITGGVLLDVAVHNADVIEYLAGPVDSVTGTVRLDEPVRHRRERVPVPSAAFYAGWHREVPDRFEANAHDVGMALLSFASSAAGQWTIHRAGHGQPRSVRAIYGSMGSIELPADRSGGVPILVSDDGARISGDDLLTLLPDYELPPVEAAIWGSPQRSHFAGDFAAIDRRLVAVELHDFARAVATGSPPEVDGEGGRRNMALVYAVTESAVARRPVTVEAVARGEVHAYQDVIDLELGLLPGPASDQGLDAGNADSMSVAAKSLPIKSSGSS